MAVINAFATLTTLTVKKGASSQSVALIRTRAGDIYFVDTRSGTGRRQLAPSSNDFVKRLFDEIEALV